MTLRSGADSGRPTHSASPVRNFLARSFRIACGAALGFGLREHRLAHLQHRRLRERAPRSWPPLLRRDSMPDSSPATALPTIGFLVLRIPPVDLDLRDLRRKVGFGFEAEQALAPAKRHDPAVACRAAGRSAALPSAST